MPKTKTLESKTQPRTPKDTAPVKPQKKTESAAADAPKEKKTKATDPMEDTGWIALLLAALSDFAIGKSRPARLTQEMRAVQEAAKKFVDAALQLEKEYMLVKNPAPNNEYWCSLLPETDIDGKPVDSLKKLISDLNEPPDIEVGEDQGPKITARGRLSEHRILGEKLIKNRAKRDVGMAGTTLLNLTHPSARVALADKDAGPYPQNHFWVSVLVALKMAYAHDGFTWSPKIKELLEAVTKGED